MWVGGIRVSSIKLVQWELVIRLALAIKQYSEFQGLFPGFIPSFFSPDDSISSTAAE
jgi:hypothetical protein